MVEFLGCSPNKAKKIGGKLEPVHPFAVFAGGCAKRYSSAPFSEVHSLPILQPVRERSLK